jgi:hypothetical protein
MGNILPQLVDMEFPLIFNENHVLAYFFSMIFSLLSPVHNTGVLPPIGKKILVTLYKLCYLNSERVLSMFSKSKHQPLA